MFGYRDPDGSCKLFYHIGTFVIRQIGWCGVPFCELHGCDRGFNEKQRFDATYCMDHWNDWETIK